jgi:hypothetical protein
MADSIKISLELADKAAQQSLTDFVNKANNADRAFKKLGDAGNQSFGGLNVSIGKALSVFDIFTANLAANVATKALEALGDLAVKAFNVFIVDGVRAAQEAEVALNALNVAMAQAGNYSEEASKDFQKFASRMQETTTFEDDLIIKNAALLQSMTTLNNQGLQRTIEAALNLSAAFGIDLETATRSLAKASEGNITSLQKLGLHFEKGSTTAATFENALGAIETRLGGTAAAQVNTYAGAIAQASNTFGDLQETIGNVIIQNPAIIAAIGEVAKIFATVNASVGNTQGALTTLVSKGFVFLVDSTEFIIGLFSNFIRLVRSVGVGFTALAKSVYDAMNFIGNTVIHILDTVIIGALRLVTGKELPDFASRFKKTFEQLKTELAGNAEGVKEAWTDDTIFTSTENGLSRVSNAAEIGFLTMETGANKAADAIQKNRKAVAELSDEQKKLNEENKKQDDGASARSDNKALYDGKLAALEAFYENRRQIESESDVTNLATKKDLDAAYFAGKQTLLEEHYANEQAIIQASIKDATKQKAALSALDLKYYTDKQKLDTAKAKADQENDKLRQREIAGHLGYISTLHSSKIKELFYIGKAAAIAQATINGFEAVSKAFAVSGPLGFVLGPLVSVAVAAQVAGIAAQQPAFEQGGIVPGISYSGDRVSARVNSGEMILNRQQQTELFKVANGGGSDNPDLPNQIASAVATAIRDVRIGLEVNGREIMNTIRNELNGGRTLT